MCGRVVWGKIERQPKLCFPRIMGSYWLKLSSKFLNSVPDYIRKSCETLFLHIHHKKFHSVFSSTDCFSSWTFYYCFWNNFQNAFWNWNKVCKDYFVIPLPILYRIPFMVIDILSGEPLYWIFYDATYPLKSSIRLVIIK